MYFHHKDKPKVRRLVNFSIFVLSFISYILYLLSMNLSICLFIYVAFYLCFFIYPSMYHSGNRWERIADLGVWEGVGGNSVYLFKKTIIKEL